MPNFLSAPFSPFLRISACGSGCGSKLSHTLTHESNPPKSKEKVLFSLKNRTFWSCWADSNCRPHPYQKVRVHFALCPLVSLHAVRSLCHKDFCIIFSLVVLPCFRPFVGRFVGNPFSHSSPKPHPLRRSIAIPSNTSSKYTRFCQMTISPPPA